MGDLANFYAPKVLGELAVGYGGQNFVAAKALPIVNTPDQTGQFQTFDKSNMALDVAGLRTSPTSDVMYVDQGVTKTDYAVKGYGARAFVPNAKDEDVAGQYLASAVHVVMGNLLRVRESVGLSLIANCGNSTSLTTKWDAAGATFGTVVAGVQEMQDDLITNSGMRGNILVMGQDAWALVAGLVAAMSFDIGIPSTRTVAQRLGLSDILVAEASYVTEINNGAWDSNVDFWTAGNVALLNNGLPTMPESSGDLDSSEFIPSYGKLVQWTNGSVMNGIEWRSVENPLKGSHGGVDVFGTLYITAVEQINGACTIADVTT